MGNDRKIEDNAKLVFLKEDPSKLMTKSDGYSLEDEFEKTRKNKNFLFYMILIGFIVLIAIGAVYWTNLIQNENKRMEINISDFEELNLKDILTASKSSQGSIDKVKQEISQLQQDYKNAIDKADNDAANEKAIIDAKNFSPDDTKAQKDAVDQKTAALKKNLLVQYQNNLAHDQDQLAQIEKSQTNFDTNKVNAAQQNEQVIDEEQKLNDLKMQQQQQSYEQQITQIKQQDKKTLDDLKSYYSNYIALLILRYNPQISEPAVKKVLNTQGKLAPLDPGSLPDYPGIFASDNIYSQDNYNSLRSKVGDFKTLISRMEKVPYTNDVPSVLNTMEAVSSGLVSNYNSLWQSVAQKVQEKDSIIRSYQYALYSYVLNNRENGYIIDPRDPQAILVYIGSSYNVKDGDTAVVFRNDNTDIGTIQFFHYNNALRAKVLSLEDTNTLQPFDKILLKQQ